MFSLLSSVLAVFCTSETDFSGTQENRATSVWEEIL